MQLYNKCVKLFLHVQTTALHVADSLRKELGTEFIELREIPTLWYAHKVASKKWKNLLKIFCTRRFCRINKKTLFSLAYHKELRQAYGSGWKGSIRFFGCVKIEKKDCTFFSNTVIYSTIFQNETCFYI